MKLDERVPSAVIAGDKNPVKYWTTRICHSYLVPTICPGISAKQPDGLSGPFMYSFVKQVKGKGRQLHESLYQNFLMW